MKFIKLTVANETIYNLYDVRHNFVIPRHNIIIPIENIIEVTALVEQDSDNRNTEIVVKYNEGTRSYVVEESFDNIYRMLEE